MFKNLNILYLLNYFNFSGEVGLMEQQGMSQIELESKGFDRQGNITKILIGKREMNLGHVRMACQIFSVKADVFI